MPRPQALTGILATTLIQHQSDNGSSDPRNLCFASLPLKLGLIPIFHRDRDETEMLGKYVPRVEATETSRPRLGLHPCVKS